MSKKVVVEIPTEVPGIDGEVDVNALEKEVNSYVSEVLAKVNIEGLGEWTLRISVTLRPSDLIGFYKLAKKYPSDREYNISLSIPVPDAEQVSYGFGAPVRKPFYKPLDRKKFYTLEPQLEEFRNLYDYLLDSSRKALDLAFEEGFTCGGIRIKNKK